MGHYAAPSSELTKIVEPQPEWPASGVIYKKNRGAYLFPILFMKISLKNQEIPQTCIYHYTISQ